MIIFDIAFCFLGPFAYTFNKYLKDTYNVLGTILYTLVIPVVQTFHLCEIYILVGGVGVEGELVDIENK